MVDIENESVEKQIIDDYGNAILTALWADSSGESRLIFGMIELYPKEITEVSELPLDGLCLGDNKNCCMPDTRLNFCRTKLSCQDALKLYNDCVDKNGFNLFGDLKEKFIKLNKKEMLEFPDWPNMTVSDCNYNDVCPFLSESWGCCRMHHILPDKIDSDILLIAEHEIPINWMNERLNWDISRYSELLGSMHLVLPNPLFRKITERMIPDSPDKVSVCIEPREGKSLKDFADVKFCCIEHGAFGMSMFQEFPLSNYENFEWVVDLSGSNTEEFSFAVVDEKRGLLNWSPLFGFIKGFNIEMRVAAAKRLIKGPRKDFEYEVTTYESIKTKGLNDEDDGWGKRLSYQRLKREQDRYAKKFGQKMFAPDHREDAEDFIRELVGQARERVVIIDPFFTTTELFDFVFGIPSPVSVTIITSKDVMNQPCTASAGKQSMGEEIQAQLDAFKKTAPDYSIDVKVMTGNKTVIHDRFLIIDDQVWFSGNSLNDIGKRLSMLIRLPNPQELLCYLNKMMSGKGERIETLEEWDRKRKKNINGKKEEQSEC